MAISISSWQLFNKADEAQQLRKIYDEALTNAECYDNLHHLCKNIGTRLSGSPGAAAAVEWARQVLTTIGADTVYLQETMVPHWVRGAKEDARIISKHIGWQSVNVCALGNSIGTGKWGITAPIIEIKHLEDLDKLGKKGVKGKIVFLNHPMDEKHIDTFDAYSGCAGDRYAGAAAVAKHEGVAFVLRSLGTGIDEFPHTGNMAYKEGIAKIPAAAIATRDAELLSGIISVDPETTFHLNMQCETLPDELSHNVIAEIKGSEKPDEIIMVSGHIDAWDNGEGAHDDGSGVVQSMEVLRIFKSLGISPKRTIRCVLYMNEENGQRGAKTYAQAAEAANENCLMAIESDRGGFTPRGFTVDAEETLLADKLGAVQRFLPLLLPYNIHFIEKGFSGVDIKHLKPQKVTCIGLVPDSQRYFDYHHTPNDTFDKVNKRELNMGAAAMASLMYLVSEHGL